MDLDPRQRAGTLSGGQRAQLALTLAVAKRPEFLVLDEPVASLDPLARREFLQSLMEVVVEHGVSVLLSSHLVADLERVCDYLVVLVSSRVRVAGEVDELLASHRRLIGPRHDMARPPEDMHVIEEQSHRSPEHVARALRRTRAGPVLDRREPQPRGPRPGLHGSGRQRHPQTAARRIPATVTTLDVAR